MAEYRLTPDAHKDLEQIAQYTAAQWGSAQQERYARRLLAGIELLLKGDPRIRRPIPDRPEFLVVKCEHHFLCALEDRPLIVVAVLHERMDLMARLEGRLNPKSG